MAAPDPFRRDIVAGPFGPETGFFGIRSRKFFDSAIVIEMEGAFHSELERPVMQPIEGMR
jgi:hypothetical protein